MTGIRKRSTDPRADQKKMTAREEEVASYNYEQANVEAKLDEIRSRPLADYKRIGNYKSKMRKR